MHGAHQPVPPRPAARTCRCTAPEIAEHRLVLQYLLLIHVLRRLSVSSITTLRFAVFALTLLGFKHVVAGVLRSA
jgi:hypothetical protein